MVQATIPVVLGKEREASTVYFTVAFGKGGLGLGVSRRTTVRNLAGYVSSEIRPARELQVGWYLRAVGELFLVN